jgi:DNA-binding IclR family transcriptional regulator
MTLARRILSLLDAVTSVTVDDIAKATGEPPEAIRAALVTMTAAGQLREDRGRWRLR